MPDAEQIHHHFTQIQTTAAQQITLIGQIGKALRKNDYPALACRLWESHQALSIALASTSHMARAAIEAAEATPPQAPATAAATDDDARRKYECCKQTGLGEVWPVKRQDMRHGPTIAERMKQDLSIYPGAPSVNCLIEAGWTPEQISAHSPFGWTVNTPKSYALLENVRAGDSLIADGGFQCLALGEVALVKSDEHGLYVNCGDGHHYLDGQADEHGRLIGLTPFVTSPENTAPAEA